MFCPKCGSILRPKKEGAKRMLFCSCGYKDKDDAAGKVRIGETITKNEQKVDIVKEGEDEIYPLVDTSCPKCGHKKAYFWTVQTRAGDEPETKFYKCEKCKHIWRDYS